MTLPGETRHQRRVRGYAVKLTVERPDAKYADLTDSEIAAVLDRCARAAPRDMYPDIRGEAERAVRQAAEPTSCGAHPTLF